jgi:hypothetical protein
MSVVEHGMNRRDADLEKTIALADGAAAVVSASIDLGAGSVFLANAEIDIVAPAMNVTEMPNAKTMVYDLQTSADDSTFTDLYSAVITQTGAGGVGCAAAADRIRLPADAEQYIRVQITGDASGDSTPATGEIRLLT